jgi:Fur family transcriptional regulator, stress-responsive regulator
MESTHKDILKNHKLSLTAVRLAILDALETKPHSDAEQLFKLVKHKISTTSKQAIYNNLNTLVEHGIIRKIKPTGHSSLYENRVRDNHHHLICRHCDLIMDTNCLDSAPCLETSENHGFAIDEAEIIFWGTCPACQKINPKETEK